MNLDERLQKDLSPDIYCLVHNKIFNLEQQCKKQQKVINKASNDLQQIMNDINDKTIISFGQFVYKLEVIQDELGGANDILKEVSE